MAVFFTYFSYLALALYGAPALDDMHSMTGTSHPFHLHSNPSLLISLTPYIPLRRLHTISQPQRPQTHLHQLHKTRRRSRALRYPNRFGQPRSLPAVAQAHARFHPRRDKRETTVVDRHVVHDGYPDQPGKTPLIAIPYTHFRYPPHSDYRQPHHTSSNLAPESHRSTRLAARQVSLQVSLNRKTTGSLQTSLSITKL